MCEFEQVLTCSLSGILSSPVLIITERILGRSACCVQVGLQRRRVPPDTPLHATAALPRIWRARRSTTHARHPRYPLQHLVCTHAASAQAHTHGPSGHYNCVKLNYCKTLSRASANPARASTSNPIDSCAQTSSEQRCKYRKKFPP